MELADEIQRNFPKTSLASIKRALAASELLEIHIYKTSNPLREHSSWRSGLARWAHNPKVDGSKPSDEIIFPPFWTSPIPGEAAVKVNLVSSL